MFLIYQNVYQNRTVLENVFFIVKIFNFIAD